MSVAQFDPSSLKYARQRFGEAHLRQRMGLETDHEADRFGQGRTYFHIENWQAFPVLVSAVLWLVGLKARGRRNVLQFQVRENSLSLPGLPPAFDGFTILQLSDLHLDSLPEFPSVLADRLSDLEYDIAVITGDYRFQTHGPWQSAMRGLATICDALTAPAYAVLGNHDSFLMAEFIEGLGVRLLLNENAPIQRRDQRFYLAGTDDPHYFEVDNLEKAYDGIPADAVSILLTHSPEIHRAAAYIGFDVLLCGHTHGGQICLPGGRALYYNIDAPSSMGAGAWRYKKMQGYTSPGTGSSVVAARFNCPPEITLHRLICTNLD